jgi:hypothetical protein
VSVPHPLSRAHGPTDDRALRRGLAAAPPVRGGPPFGRVRICAREGETGTIASVVNLVLVIALLSLDACKTPNPKEDEVIFINPTTQPSTDDAPSPTSHPTQPQPSILSEPVRPVRGGPKVLPAYHGEDPCKMALVGDSPVAKSCSEGGIRRATEMMQMFVKRARAEGIVFVCTDCHPDEDDFSKLAPGVDVEFRKLLFLARPAD